MQSLHSSSLGHLIARPYKPERTRASLATKSTDLSSRELEVLKLVAQALTDSDIAKKLHITCDTVRRHTINIRDKIGADNRVAMAMYAVRNGLAEA